MVKNPWDVRFKVHTVSEQQVLRVGVNDTGVGTRSFSVIWDMLSLTETEQQDLVIVQGYRGEAHGMAKIPSVPLGVSYPTHTGCECSVKTVAAGY